MDTFDVGIVGCGPVGAVLATLLAKAGLAVGVFERDATPYALPRAGHFDDEIMRVIQNAGIADELAPSLTVGVGMKFLDAAGHVLVDWPRPQQIGPQGWHASYRFHQPELERLLRRALAHHSTREARLRADVYAIDQDENAVRLRYENLATGQLHEARCRYLVGCDGGRSTVRRFMGVSPEDLGVHDQWLVIDVLLHAPLDTLQDATLQICDPARPTTIARGAGLRRRWEFKLMPGDDPATIARPESVWPMLAPWLRPAQGILERATVYTFHAAIAPRWRIARLLLAGDAAHLSPPFMGQGLCAGFRDAMNLAWKLVSVLRDHASDDLLDTYQSERAPHVRAFINEAVRLGEIVQVTDPAEVEARDRRMRENPEFLRTITPRLGPGLAADAPPPVGTLAPQPRLPSGDRMDDVVGMRFALLATAAFLATLSPATTAAIAAADIVTIPDVANPWLAQHDIQAALLRPDRYVLGVATTPTELAALLKRLPAKREPALSA